MPDLRAWSCLQGCGLPAAWAHQNSWRVLDTRFAKGLNFLATWALWQADAQRPHCLHYVAIAATPPELGALGPPASLASLLADQCFGLLPGFHRMTFEQGRVSLTLCIGDLKTVLREQRFLADSVFLAPTDLESNPPERDTWTAQALARCCRRGTRVATGPISPQPSLQLRQTLAQSGFELDPVAPSGTPQTEHFSGIYNPRWEPKTSRYPSAASAASASFTALAKLPQQPTSCAVIGAGLAGASVAQALARRGWQVTVLDAAAAPAEGASGVPVGLMAPHVSADDSPRSRLSRAGIRLTLQQACALLVKGQDWDASGVLERRMDGPLRLPPFFQPPFFQPPVLQPQGLDWSAPAPRGWTDAAWASGLPPNSPALWHAQGGWIKPAALIRAWLAQPGVRFQGNANVAKLVRDGDAWVLLDAGNRVLTRASTVVFAAAGGMAPLMAQLRTEAAANATQRHSGGANGLHTAGADTLPAMPVLHPVSGQVSWAFQRPSDSAALPPYPVNGLGSLVAHVPMRNLLGNLLGGLPDGLMGSLMGSAMSLDKAWFTGATYEAQLDATPTAAWAAAQHHVNLARLQTLLPASAAELADSFANGSIQFWRGTRYATADRLPVVGPLTSDASPTVWASTGLGSRGLSLCVLCAELLAARLGGEPWPVGASLAAKISLNRLKNR